MSITYAVQLTPIFAIASSNKGSTSSGIELEVEELELLEELEIEVEEELSSLLEEELLEELSLVENVTSLV